MLGFSKIYFWQLLKIVLAGAGIFIGLFVPLYAAVQPSALPEILLVILLVLLPAAGFLAGIFIPFLIEYRGRLTTRNFLGEALLMLIAFVFVGIGISLGIVLGAAGVNSFVTSDGTGLAMLFFLFSGAILGIIPGIVLGALAITLWKWRNSKKVNLS